MIRLFVGWDEREEAGSHIFNSSVIQHASEPVSIVHLNKDAVARTYGVDIAEGTNAFTMSRFLVPALCDFVGYAIFADGADMLCRGDIADLWAMRNPHHAVQVVQHNYTTRNPRKYVGSRMEATNRDYGRKNWASLMLMFCGHMAWRKVTPAWLAQQRPIDVLSLRFLADERIGALDPKWNWLADEYGPAPDAKILHWTAGVPGFPEYHAAYHSDEWRRQQRRVNYLTD